jgi:hypothetical protein
MLDFDDVGYFNEGRAVARKGSNYYLVNKAGKKVTGAYKKIGYRNENRWAVFFILLPILKAAIC